MINPGALLAKAVRYELALWHSLYRWAARRPVAAAGERPFGYSDAIKPILWAFIILSAIEIPVFHLLIPWPTVRFIGLLAGAYGLLWMIGLLASLRVYPHVVTHTGLRIRYATSVDISLPWTDIAELRTRGRTLDSGATVQLDDTGEGTTASIAISHRTNIELDLRRPLTVTLPKGEQVITQLRFFVDDQAGFVLAARESLAATVA
jgi:hypothetical protein